MSLVKVENLSVDYIKENGANNAIKDVSLQVNDNEILGIVGESGCGKSTLIKSIMRILNAPGLITSGSIEFNGQDITSMNEDDLYSLRWKEISLVKQKALNSLNPVMKIGDQLAMPYTQHLGLDKSKSQVKARELLDLVGIDQIHFESFPHELSGGMRQRVIIAIALALKPKLVIMDEPTTALDVVNEHDIIHAIKDLQEQFGFSIIFITHDLNLLLQLADRMYVLLNGEIVDSGSVQEIKSGGSHEYTQKLLDSMPRIKLESKNHVNKTKVLSLKNVNVSYQLGSWIFPDRLNAVNNVSFDLYKGGVTALIGESGSGKSTIAKVISGLEQPTSGNVEDLISNSEIKFNLEYRKNVQMIFQDPFSALNPIHTVFHHFQRPFIRFGVVSREDMFKEASRLLRLVELEPAEDFLKKYPHEMSGGECQRVCIARALIPGPKLIIADEPTSMLDVSIRKDILELFIKLKEDFQTSILLITHDIASASICSDYILVLKDGSVIESGPSEKILSNPNNVYTKTLIDASDGSWYKTNKENVK